MCFWLHSGIHETGIKENRQGRFRASSCAGETNAALTASSLLLPPLRRAVSPLPFPCHFGVLLFQLRAMRWERRARQRGARGSRSVCTGASGEPEREHSVRVRGGGSGGDARWEQTGTISQLSGEAPKQLHFNLLALILNPLLFSWGWGGVALSWDAVSWTPEQPCLTIIVPHLVPNISI